MNHLISAVIYIAVVLFGTPDSTPAPAQVQVQEDEAGWDCATMGNKDCGPATVSQEDADQAILAQDAQVTWGDYFKEPMTGTTISYTWVAYAHEEPKDLPATQVAVQSLDLGIWHVYRADWLRQA